MTEKKRPLLDEMARIRAEQEKAARAETPDSEQETQAPASPDPASPRQQTDPLTRSPGPQTRPQVNRPMRSATPVDHAKAFADLKKAQLKKQRRSRWLRFFRSRD
jgi:hypothetical protein